MNAETPPPVPKKSSGKGCLMGLGIGCLVVLIVLGVLGFVGYRFVKNHYYTIMTRFEREGYHKVEGQILEITDRVTEPTIFVGQVVHIKNGSDRGVALLCQDAEIEGQVVGNVHFIGQLLTVKKNAELMRDLDVKAQTVNVYGTVRGQITGVYQTLNKEPSGGK